MKLRISATAKQSLEKTYPKLYNHFKKEGFDKIRWEGNLERADYFIVGKYGLLGIHDVNGRQLLGTTVDELGLLNHPLVIFKINGFWGILNPKRDYSVAIHAKYDYAVQKTMVVGEGSNAKEVHVLVIRGSQIFGIGLDLKETLIPTEENPQQHYRLFKEIKSEPHFTYGGPQDINTTTTERDEPEKTTKKDKPEKWRKSYDSVDEFKTDYAIVKKNDKFGLVDRNGKVKVPIQYEIAYAMGDNEFKFRDPLGEILMWKPEQ